VVEKQGVVLDRTEVANDLQTYTTLEADHFFFPIRSISLELYFWNYPNIINYFGVSE
jgi:hypothetical protein